MQSTLFAYQEQQTQDRYSLQNGQLLRVALDGRDDLLARKGTMVAFQGLVEFDAEYEYSGRQQMRAHTGEGLDLMRCHGQGTVYLANLAQYVHIMDVEQEGLAVDSSYVLAMDSSLHYEVVAVDSLYGISGSGKYQLNITGRGKVALMTSGAPLLMQVTPDKYINCDADAIVAWSTALRVQMQAQTHASGVWHRRGHTGEGWELSFMGTGFALVQPSELLPPQNAMIGPGLRAQYGMGQQGARGQNQGNVWS